MANHGSKRIALVTGGSNGIGSAICSRLSKNNYTVINADILTPEQEFPEVIYRKCDVREGNEIDSLFEWFSENVGLPSVVILNAGQGIHERLTEGDPGKWENIIRLNLLAPLRCIRAFVPPMQEQKSGHVIFISSVSAMQPYQYGGVYSASKAALEMIAETLRLETAPDIKVTVIAAGITDTKFFEYQISGSDSIESIGMGAISANDVADDVLYALSKTGSAAINKIITRPAGQSF
ncbi:MAG TPA: SDR family oxidoreductase [Flavobacterium sp.]|jgi:NADP-dependent 3-hydroxy acid dehydrogenase YdfG